MSFAEVSFVGVAAGQPAIGAALCLELMTRRRMLVSDRGNALRLLAAEALLVTQRRGLRDPAMLAQNGEALACIKTHLGQLRGWFVYDLIVLDFLERALRVTTSSCWIFPPGIITLPVGQHWLRSGEVWSVVDAGTACVVPLMETTLVVSVLL